MKYKVTIMFVPADPQEETASTSWEEDYLNHNDAADHAVRHLFAAEGLPETDDKAVNAQRDEGLSIIVQPTPETEYDTPIYFRNGPRPNRDNRDSTGSIEREMLRKHTGEQGANQHAANIAWLEAHPEFATEYLLELQRIERELLAAKLREEAAGPQS